jgi:hypothetical protein
VSSLTAAAQHKLRKVKGQIAYLQQFVLSDLDLPTAQRVGGALLPLVCMPTGADSSTFSSTLSASWLVQNKSPMHWSTQLCLCVICMGSASPAGLQIPQLFMSRLTWAGDLQEVEQEQRSIHFWIKERTGKWRRTGQLCSALTTYRA